MTYKNLEQRMISTYLDTFPPFVPAKTDRVSKNSQEQFYLFMKSIYQSIYEDQQLLFTQLNEEDAYESYFNKSNDKKPDLIKLMKKDIKAMEDLLFCMFSIGLESEIDDNSLVINESFIISKKHLSLFPRFGLSFNKGCLTHASFPDMFPAWKWMTTREGASVFEFSRCMFDKDYSYASDIIAALTANQYAFHQMEESLIKSGYIRKVKYGNCISLGFTTNNSIVLDYVKKLGETDKEPGNFVYDHFYTGLSFEYSIIMKKKKYFGLRILHMKEILDKFDLMSDSLKSFIVTHTKQCDMCGYCIFNKWDKRKPLSVAVSHNGKYKLCPIFPGYRYCFNEMDESLSKNIMEFLLFMDKEILS